MYRVTVARASRSLVVPSRTLHSSPVAFKTATDKAKDVAHDVNMKVGQGLASAIEKGEQVTEKAKEAVGATTKDAKAKAEQASTQAKQTAEQATAQAKQKGNQAAAGAYEAKEDFKKELRK